VYWTIFNQLYFIVTFLLLEKENTTFGFCNASNKLVDISALLRAARAHSIPGLGVSMHLEELMENLTLIYGDTIAGNCTQIRSTVKHI